MLFFEEDVIIVAGGTGRVGGATVKALHDAGARVVVVSRSPQNAGVLCRGYERATAAVADLGDPSAVTRLVEETATKFGRLDAVVNLAGRGKFVAIRESSVEDLRSNLDAFVVTAYNLSVAALRRMLDQKYREGRRSRGHIVTVTAGSSKDPQPRFGLFGAAKAAVNTLMRAIAREHKHDGIVANAVVLGTVATDAARSYLDPADFEAAASPEEVGRVLAFLASSASDGINGELVDLNARETD
jgi:NAD(P)-dependent dehydrogenase (short-subunit alcohol dehydrogenase family)